MKKICNLRSHYDVSNEFFIEFFKYIFKNPNIYIITHNNKIVDDLIIKIQEDIFNCIPGIKYRNKLKNVNINIGGKLYGLDDHQFFVSFPLKDINLDNIIIESDIDSFTIDNFTIKELNEIKKIFLDSEKQIMEYNKVYFDLLNSEIMNKEIREKAKNYFIDKIYSIKKIIGYENEINEEVRKEIIDKIVFHFKGNKNDFEERLLCIKKITLLNEIENINCIKKKYLKYQIKKR